MRTLLYANSPDKAREIIRWADSLGAHVPLEITVLRIKDTGPAEAEAAATLVESLTRSDAGWPAPVLLEREGAPEEVITDTARQGEYGLVALTRAGRKGFIRLFYGSMVAHVVQRVSTSVLVIRRKIQVPPRRILVCVSGSKHSLTDVSLAAQLAGSFGSQLHILLVLSQISVKMKGAESWDAEPAEFTQSDHPLAAHLRVAAKVAEGIGVKPVVRVRQGLISEEILSEVREGEHELLVLGTHRADDFDPMYADITDELVLASPVTTLVVGLRASLF